MVSHWNPKKIGRLFGWFGFLKKNKIQTQNPKKPNTQLQTQTLNIKFFGFK
jgi:hypothetical protein